jgi:serine/threonine protein kinase
MLKALIQQKYEFNEDEDLINFGAYGQVFKIKDKKVNTEYVLKKLLKSAPNNQNNGTDAESFDKEIDNLKRLKGNNIINIIDYYSDKKDKFFYIILEKMDGDLNQMLKEKHNKMSSNMIRKIFKQLNSALNIMIKEKRCHRDLKPENILYSYTNNDKSDFIIKLGDFGLATDLYLTRSTNAGTPIFKAPEIGFKNYYADKCDLYSIGVILYMLKTGEIIFKGNNLEDIITNKKFGNLKKTKNNKIIEDDDNLNDLINKLVVNDPNERLNWNDYFNHPFFKENEEIKKIEKSKIEKILIRINEINKEIEQENEEKTRGNSFDTEHFQKFVHPRKYINLEKEKIFIINFSNKLIRILNDLKQSTSLKTTAVSYFRRFYLKKSIVDYDPQYLMVASFMLGSKVAQINLPLDKIEKLFPFIRENIKKVLDYEFFLTTILDYNFFVYNPYHALYGLIYTLEQKQFFLGQSTENYINQENFKQECIDIIDKMLLTDNIFLYTYSEIALASILVKCAEKSINISNIAEKMEIDKIINVKEFLEGPFGSNEKKFRSNSEV